MKKLNIMALDFTYKAQIAGFESAILIRNWNGIDTLEFTINSEVTNADLIEIDDVIWFNNDYHKGFIIERKEETLQGNSIEFKFVALGLTSLLRDFVTVPPDLVYDTATGTRENVVRQWVENNCITRLTQYPISLGTYQTLGDTITDQTRYANLFDEIQRVLSPGELGFNLTIDLTNSEYVFNVEEGTDRTTSAPTYAPRVIFGLEYGNLSEYSKVSDTASTKNFAYIGGTGEADARVIATVDASTVRKKEIFVDARDVTVEAELQERGGQTLTELMPIDSFDFNVIERQFIYETDYDLGDYVTVVLSKTVSKDLQIQAVKEIYEKGNIKIIPSFGETDRTLGNVIKNIAKRVTQIEVNEPASGSGGTGDMLKATYDTNNDGKVNSADSADTVPNKAITLAKMADMATASFIGRNTAMAGVPEILSKATALSILNVADGANAYVHPNHSGDVTSVADGAQTIAKTAITGKTEVTADATDYILISDTTDSGNLKKALFPTGGSGDVNESATVNVSTDDSASVVGQVITMTDNTVSSLTETYTLLTGESSHTFKVLVGHSYTISVDTKSLYTSPSALTYTAIAGNTRTIAMQYLKLYRYGFRRTKATTDPEDRIEYLYDAVGLTPAYMDFTSGNFNFGSWQTFTEEVSRPVMLKNDGTVDYALSRTDFTKKSDGVTASAVDSTAYAGNAMIEFGKYKWVYRYEDATYEYVIFSNGQYDANYKALAHTNELGTVKDYFYWGACKGSNVSSKLRSIATGAVMVSQTRNTEVSYATGIGSGYYTIYKSGWDFICDLLTLISKSDDCQTKFGTGRSKSTNTTAIACGTLKAQPMFKGYNDETSDVKVFGIEGFWGNVWEGMAGLVFNTKIKTKMVPPYNFDGAGYVDSGITPSGTSGGFISSAQVGEQGFIPKVASGSGTTYYCDGLWFDTAQVDYALVGGNWDDALSDGCRFVNLNSLASVASAGVGSRLSYLNPA